MYLVGLPGASIDCSEVLAWRSLSLFSLKMLQYLQFCEFVRGVDIDGQGSVYIWNIILINVPWAYAAVRKAFNGIIPSMISDKEYGEDDHGAKRILVCMPTSRSDGRQLFFELDMVLTLYAHCNVTAIAPIFLATFQQVFGGIGQKRRQKIMSYWGMLCSTKLSRLNGPISTIRCRSVQLYIYIYICLL